MLTGKLRNQVDKIWESFWTGGIANPISVIEQFSFLLFIRRLDDIHTLREKAANAFGTPIENPIFIPEQDAYRWSKFKNRDPQQMFELVRDKVFPFIKTLHGEESTFAQHMKDAIFMIPRASLLDQVVQLIDRLDMEDRDTKGDLYEYMLSKLTTAGTNGQFRTPRHIINMMVAMQAPVLDGDKSDLICDPAAGTCGFLMAAEEYVRRQHPAKLLQKKNAQHFHNSMFTGYDFDQSMLRIGAMNLLLHGIENPTVTYRDSLSDFGDANIRGAYTLILANPPFKGSVAYDELAPDLLTALGKSPKKTLVKRKQVEEDEDEDNPSKEKKGPSEKTELLFLALILRMLKAGGRAAVIVPDGVLCGSTKSHQQIREMLVEKHKLEAVVSMPSGVFKPYAGVSTAILFFTKTGVGGTDKVWFYDMQADGYSLDDKRMPLISDEQRETLFDRNEAAFESHDKCNIPDIIARWFQREQEQGRARTDQSFMVPKDEIAQNGNDLSINRYKQVVFQEVQYDPPKVILGRIKELQRAMDKGIAALERML
jgi:type I restriction enzyme M protein